MICPNCSKENPTASRFCQFCGFHLGNVHTQIGPAAAQPLQKQSADVAFSDNPPPRQLSQERPTSLRQSDRPDIGQLGQGGLSAASIWGPFAGYGARGRHVSWLLDDLGHKAEDVHHAFLDRFNQRKVPGSEMSWRSLVAQGLIVERRPFYFIQRGITTVALYIARFGKDLYISQTTYVKGPISNIRLVILGLMLLFSLYFTFIYSSAVSGALGSIGIFGGGGSFPFFLLCVIGPLGAINQTILGLILLFSIYKWIREKDFAAILRAPANEFQKDDTIALEKAVEETLRQSLDEVGIEPQRLSIAQEYSFSGRPII